MCGRGTQEGVPVCEGCISVWERGIWEGVPVWERGAKGSPCVGGGPCVGEGCGREPLYGRGVREGALVWEGVLVTDVVIDNSSGGFPHPSICVM